MKTKELSFLRRALCVAFAVMLLSVSVFADGAGSKYWAAQYNADGQMLNVSVVETKDAKSIDVVNGAENVRFFQVNDNTHQPESESEEWLVVAQPGRKYSGGTYYGVIILPAVGNGDVTLAGVTAGKLIVQGGGENSIHLDSCQVDTIQVDKDTTAQDAQQPRIELNNTPVGTIEAVQPVIIEADAKSAVQAVEAKSDVTVQGAATKIEKVTVPAEAGNDGVKITVDGANVKAISAEKPVTIDANNNASPIETVETKDNLTVQGDAARIEKVEVPDTATKKPVIDVQAGTVDEVKADKPAEVKSTTGTGAVTNVEANAEVKVASETVTTITVKVQVTITVTGTSDVEVAVETASAVSVVTSNTNISVSTTLNEAINVVTKETESSAGTKVTHVHKWNETSRTPATCSKEGTVTYTCVGEGTCDKGYTKTETLAKLPHTEKIVPAVVATCTTTGLTAGKVCDECNAVLVAQTTVPALGHSCGDWISEIPAGVEAGTKGHYHCDRCGKNFDKDYKELADIVIPSSYASVSTLDELAAAMQNVNLQGAVLAADIEVPDGELPVDKALIVPAGKTLTVSGILKVYGTLNNEGTINNQVFIDVIGGTLTNSGELACNNGFGNGSITVFGGTLSNTGAIWGDGQDTTLSVENGGTLDNVINNAPGKIEGMRISIVDYYPASGDPAISRWKLFGDERDYTAPELDYFDLGAVAFGTNAIQTALDVCVGEQEGWYRYQYVIACGTDAEPAVNTVELGGITVHEGGMLMLCNWMADELYRNDYLISEKKTLTLNENARLEGHNWGSATITIDGTIKNNGGSFDFGGFTVNGKNAPVIVSNEKELTAALANGGDIYLCPFAEENRTDVSAAFDDPEGTDLESQYRLKNTHTISKNTTLIGLGGEPIAVFFDGGFTVNSGVTLALNGLNAVAVQNSTVSGTVEAIDGMMVVQGAENTTLTVSETGKIVVGQPNRWGGLAIFQNGNKIVNNGIIENFGDLIFDRDPRNGQFSGNEPIEYANLRDLVCELYHRFDGMPNMVPVDYEKKNEEGGIVDLGGVYAYPDGGSQMFNEENPDDSDFDALGAFSWFIKNDIIPEYNAETSPELHPYELVTKEQAAELLNSLGNKILGTTGKSYTDLSGGDYLCRTNNIQVEHENWKTSELRQTVDTLEGYFASLRSVDVTSEAGLLAALKLPYVRKIHVTESMTILGTKDESDPNFAGCCYLNNEGHNGEVYIYIHGVATLTVGDAGHRTKLDIGEGVTIELIRIDGSHAKVVVSENSCVNVLGGLTASGENWDYNEFFIGNINRFPNVMDLGRELLERLGAYELPTMTGKELADNHERAHEWPDGDDRIDGFKLLVKHGGLKPITETDGQGNNYIVWRPYNKITYGVAIDVLTNIYKAIDTKATTLPASVALGDEAWTPNSERLINDHDLEELLNKFVVALPKVEDSTTTNITLIRDNVNEGDTNLTNDGMTITGKIFTKHITITCDPQYLNGDDFGGDIQFVNCKFQKGVTVKMTVGVGYNVRLNNSCTGAFTVTAENDVNGQDRTNVNFFGMSGVTINGLTISGNVTDTRDEDFNVNVRYDKEGGNSYISTVEIYNSTDKTVTVETSNEATYTGKLRVAGKLDISGVTLVANSRIELSNQCYSEIALGSNNILVNDDCGGEYSFTGTGSVIVANQNQYANITVNGKKLGTPHIYGEHCDGIFFPLANTTGISFKVEQGRWNDKTQCAENWTELSYTVDQQTDKLHLVAKDGKPWIQDPYQVRVTVTVGGCSVVYDTMMWKPVQIGEFVDALNSALNVEYAFHDYIDETWEENDYLTYDMAKKVIDYVKANYEGAADIDIESIIRDKNYWEELKKWTSQYKEAESSHDENWLRDLRDRNPDNWTWDWFFANDVIRNLKSVLGIKDTYGEVSLHLYRDQEHNNETLKAQIGDEWIDIDGNTIRDCRFTGTVTVVCDTERSGNDDFGGCIFFENCDFEQGVTVELKHGINYGVRFNNCTGVELTLKDVTLKDGANTLAPLTLTGSSIAVDVRYDECDRDEHNQPIYIATAEIRSESEEPETITVSGSGFNGKLRISGSANVSGLSFGKKGWLELSNNGDSSIALGRNEILVNDDCGGHYSFTGTGRVILPNQNQYANITVNGINLGTPHIFGRDGFGIFFPLTGTWNEENNILTVNEGTVTFTVEQGRYSEDLQRVPDDAWTTLECTVEVKQDGSGIHLVVAENESWITDPYQVRVTVTVADGCTVVYDTMMWKPVQMDEFIRELNTRLNKGYTLDSLGISKTEGDLTIGTCKTAFEAIWADFEKTDSIDMNTIINDERYWNELAWWETEYQKAWESGDEFWISDMENRTPDNWTVRWNDLDRALDKLGEALDPTETDIAVTRYGVIVDYGIKNISTVQNADEVMSLTLFTEEGKKITYEVDKDAVTDGLNIATASALGQLVEYELDSSNVLTSITVPEIRTAYDTAVTQNGVLAGRIIAEDATVIICDDWDNTFVDKTDFFDKYTLAVSTRNAVLKMYITNAMYIIDDSARICFIILNEAATEEDDIYGSDTGNSEPESGENEAPAENDIYGIYAGYSELISDEREVYFYVDGAKVTYYMSENDFDSSGLDANASPLLYRLTVDGTYLLAAEPQNNPKAMKGPVLITENTKLMSITLCSDDRTFYAISNDVNIYLIENGVINNADTSVLTNYSSYGNYKIYLYDVEALDDPQYADYVFDLIIVLEP